ncbi:calcium-binding protein [Streptomyces sp. 6N223]|uniref:calcium-binding protein n=1 Tax=Streptomyces sp. 6N223 TaxID=3457412 RepID=UPI003FD354FE
MRKTATAVGLGVLALAGTGLAASPAAADSSATAYTDDGGHAVYYTAGDTSSDVRITQGDDYTQFVIDDIVPIDVGDGCVHPDASDATYVVCTLTEFGDFWTHVVADLGAGSDALWLRAGDENSVHGGPGHDNLNVNVNAVVFGEDGDDWMVGGFLKYGGPGDDGMSGFGNDFAAYGEDGDDYIYASTGSEALYGGRGHDTIEARGGHDLVYGNSGEDTLIGGKGGDDLYGGPDADAIYGNSGNDLLRGGGGSDQLSGGPGTDDVSQD